MIEQSIYIPDMPPESLNFQNGGYDSTLFMLTSRSVMINFIFIILLGLVTKILSILVQRHNIFCVTKTVEKINKFIFFGAINRLFIESFADLSLCCLLNVANIVWKNGVESVIVSNIISIICLLICSVFPICFGVYAFINRSKWLDDGF